jgi:hypothetical protein
MGLTSAKQMKEGNDVRCRKRSACYMSYWSPFPLVNWQSRAFFSWRNGDNIWPYYAGEFPYDYSEKKTVKHRRQGAWGLHQPCLTAQRKILCVMERNSLDHNHVGVFWFWLTSDFLYRVQATRTLQTQLLSCAYMNVSSSSVYLSVAVKVKVFP